MSFLPFREMPIGGGGSTVFPFNVIGSGTNQAMVQSNGSLLLSYQPNDKQVIVGFDTFFTVNDQDCIWLELQFDQFGNILDPPDGAQINNGSLGVFNPTTFAWQTNAYVQYDSSSSYQQYSRTLIAQVRTTGQVVTIDQKLTTNLILNNSCIDFSPAKFPIPAAYSPYIAP